MKQLKFKGFTLIELLIVVAIIAILAAIAVPNFLEAQVRSKVSRSRSDMRTLATALESYFVDANTYVGSAADDAADTAAPLGVTVNSNLKRTPAVGFSAARPSPPKAVHRITFQTYRPQQTAPITLLNGTLPGGKAQTLTTPIAYLTSFSGDPFADSKGSTFGYYNAGDAAWIAWSYGPDTDEMTANGQIQSYLWGNANILTESVYSPYVTNPTLNLLTGVAPVGTCYTYDATNGTTSAGDVYRVKQ